MSAQLLALLASEAAAGVAAGVLALLGLFVSADSVRWEAQKKARQKERAALERLRSLYDGNPYSAPQYDRWPSILALATPSRQRRARLLGRSRVALNLTGPEQVEGCALTRTWIDSVGAMAWGACFHEAVPLRRFLQTNHLAVIRQGSLALPFIVCMLRRAELTAEETDRAAAGLALMELAAHYNSVSRVQRDAVYFSVGGNALALGPVVRAPRRGTRWLLNIVDSCSPQMPLRGRRVKKTRKLLTRLSKAL